MSAPTDTVRDMAAEPPSGAPAAAAKTRPFYWSVRRELWENRSIYIAPAVVAGVVLFGFVVGAGRLPGRMRHLEAFDLAKQAHLAALPFALSAFAILATGFLVGVFYCLGALHGERRDRSILFWKSLPVSDLTTVLAKASIPMLVMPIVVFAVVVATHLVMLLLGGAVLAANGVGADVLWGHWPFFHMSVMLLYTLFVLALWHAPIWAWLLLVSAWAKRVTFLWAVAPPFALCVFEKIAFDTSYVGQSLKDRFAGGIAAGFTDAPGRHVVFDLMQPDPLGFVLNPGLWGGLAVAAGFLAGAVWLRRNREPI